jgi:hypothetical protein
VRQSAGARPRALFADGQVELSVHYVSSLDRFVEVQMRGLWLSDPRTAIGLRWAVRPEGPWSPLAAVYRPVESTLPNAADLIAYAAKAHPEQRGADVVLTYVVNDPRHATPADAIYYPEPLRLSFAQSRKAVPTITFSAAEPPTSTAKLVPMPE